MRWVWGIEAIVTLARILKKLTVNNTIAKNMGLNLIEILSSPYTSKTKINVLLRVITRVQTKTNNDKNEGRILRYNTKNKNKAQK